MKYQLEVNQWVQLQTDFVIGRFKHLRIKFDINRIYFIYIVKGELQLSNFSSPLSSGHFIILSSDQTVLSQPGDYIIFQLPINSLVSAIPSILNLNLSKYTNKWIAGYGDQIIKTTNFSMAYVVFDNQDEFNTQLLPREIYHKHTIGIEYYLVLTGTNQVRIEDSTIELSSFEVLEIPTGLCHKWVNATFPQKGLNFRFPSIDGDKEHCQS